MRSLLLRCYPSRWRARYGSEFLAVLDERPLRPRDVADVLLGAVDAQLQPSWTGLAERGTRGSAVAARVGGIAAVIGAPLWTAGFVLANDRDTTTVGGLGMPAGILVIGSLLMLIALLGLSATQATVRPLIAWASSLLPATGAVAMAVGATIAVIDGAPPEALFLGLFLFFVGSLLFALVAVGVGVLSRTGAVLLAVAPIVALAGGSGDGVGGTLIVSGLIVFDAGWVVLGALAVLRSRPTTTTRIA